jgi:hypothetical protein
MAAFRNGVASMMKTLEVHQPKNVQNWDLTMNTLW